MFISRLEMIGFKSFATKTALDFRPGVMAVVGPNGCGKTNIVDAIRWVLGEQRSHTIRAERMESVIFNGTSQRRPLGMAEVTLTIENDKGLLPSTYTQVAITRRLFRSGESEYLINRNPCRLRDINDLFADTGLGSNAYSIIELSMVEGIITGSSDSRRALIEEAAGIAKYKSRRTAALKRLDQTRENLDRVEDIFREVEKTYTALRRQAARARRYQKLTRALQLRLVADLSEERLAIVFKRKPLEERLMIIEEEHQQAENDATQATSELLSLEGRELSLLDRSRRTQDSLKRLEQREAELRGELALTKQRITFLESQQAKAGDRKTELSDLIQSSEKHSEQAAQDAEQLERELKETQSEIGSIEKQIKELSGKLDQLRIEAREARQVETEARSLLSNELEQHRRIEDDRNQLTGRHKRLQAEIVNLEDGITSLTKELKELEVEFKRVTESKADYEKQFVELRPERDRLRERLDEAFAQRARKSAQNEAAKASLQAHKRISASPSSLPKSIRKIAESENLKSLGSRIECEKKYEKPLSAVLYPILEALDRPDKKTAAEIASNIEDGFQVVLRSTEKTTFNFPQKQLPPQAKACAWGYELIQNNDSLGDFLKNRLIDVIVAPDLDTLFNLTDWAINNHCRIVTLDGLFFEPDGIFHSAKITAENLAIGWTSRLKELERDAANSEKSLNEAEKKLSDLKDEFEKTDKLTNEIQSLRFKNQNQHAQLERNLADKTAQLSRKQQRLVEATSELEQLASDLEGLHQINIEFDADLESDLSNKTKKRTEIESNLQNEESLFKNLTDRGSTLRAESARLTERIDSARKNRERYAAEAKQALENLAKLNAALTDGETELKRVGTAAESLAGQIELLEREKKDVSEQVAQVRTERTGIREERDKATQKLNNAQERQKDALKDRNKIEGEVITLRERLREVDRRLSEDADVPPSSVTDATPGDALAELEVLEMGDIPIDKLKIRLQALGPVNMLALEELDAVEERYKFLIDQKQDLVNGIELIEETIDQINHEARSRFRETFSRIDEYFQEVFRTLFEGGEARITLQDGDPLEADIRIWATPSGKKLQALSMLSGGEKALTAIALLFAIYRVRPSPFCILDEVDAPLDDSNVARFNKLVRDYSKNTQFMIVTHNKRTMEASDCLFGVTLGDVGTSRLLSVKIEGGKNEVVAELEKNNETV